VSNFGLPDITPYFKFAPEVRITPKEEPEQPLKCIKCDEAIPKDAPYYEDLVLDDVMCRQCGEKYIREHFLRINKGG
jgi:hypothetical protein